MLAYTIDTLNEVLWGIPFMTFIIFIGCYFTLRSGFFPLVHFGHVMNNTFCKLWSKEANQKQTGAISSFEAVCIAIGGCVGCGNIGGVATAIATGGPGAVFWMWLWAFFGMMIKCVETSLGCYYRSRNERGEFFGGSTYFMEKGIGQQMHHRMLGKMLAVAFGIGFIAQFLGGSQAYTIAEIMNRSFGVDMIGITLAYSVLLFYIILKGTPRIAAFATRAVPFMCVLFIVGGVGLMICYYQNIPGVMYAIFHDAFTGTAAGGGFAGAAVSRAISDGLARSINSNEAGQGSSPFVYGSADTIHPIRQGLWGCFDVFINTIVVCSVTAFSVLAAGTWTSGQSGATLTIMAYESVYGSWGSAFIGVVAFLFGITTTTGWFSYYVAIINHGFRGNPVLRDRLTTILKYLYPIPNIVIVSSIVLTGNGPDLFWNMVNITLIVPVFTNLLGLFLLRNQFWALLYDYKARYMGIGELDPNFHVFYEEEKAILAPRQQQLEPTSVDLAYK